ncbi:MAG: Ig-like domain-containing protein [Gemmatimonadota bacterium]|nr:Ig-like domain-containing protein [Gemmatimonadota bacterium]
MNIQPTNGADPRRPRQCLPATLALAAFWTVSCDDEIAPPLDPSVATTITVSPATAQLGAVGATVQLTARVLDQHGQAMADATVIWASAATDVATVSSSGLVTAVGGGMAAITASAGEVSDTAAVTVARDREVLEALFNAADGRNWHNSENWLTGEPLADWHGVEVDAGGRVTKLDLTDNNLAGTIPPDLGDLAHLESLLLDDNFDLTGPIPPELGNLVHLRRFSLAGTAVTDSIPPELGNLSSLRTLWLVGTLLTGAIPPELGNLSNLDTLALAFNSLTGGIPAELGNLSNLKMLWLDRNQLTGPIPPEFGNLLNLEALSIEANKFDGFPVSGTGVTGPIPPELASLSNLTILRLSQNSLTGAIPTELGGLAELQVMSLASNELAGAVPSELGQLASLEELNLAHNADLAGVLPASLTALGALKVFQAGGTGLCAPSDPGFIEWLGGLTRRRIAICEAEQAAAYLTQAVQSRTFPVPLVAGEAALLRVFVTAPGGADANIPLVRARFYLGGAETHVADIPGQSTAIPAEIDESSLSKSANAEIPAEIVQPGLEMVIEIDPESTLNPGLGIARRIPEQGRAKVEVRAMPPFDLTVVPFLWSPDPDSSVLETGGADDEFFRPTRTLLPVGEFGVDKHEPVFTSSNDVDGLLEETRAIRVMEGGTGYYLGMMSGDLDGPQGVAELGAPLAAAVANPFIAAHELGHTMALQHAPCGGAGADPAYPQLDGSIGAFGYDFRDGGRLVPASAPDLMSYCGPPWIGDYHFGNALAFRLLEEGEAMAAAEPTRTILLWGGIDDAGAPFLEPAFVVDAPPSLPRPGGEYEITGRSEDGGTLFSLSFHMPDMADGGGRSSFAFALPAQPGWSGDLASITLFGPGGSVTLDADTDRPMAILRNSGTGRVIAILRDPAHAEPGRPGGIAAARDAEPGLKALFSRGMPTWGHSHRTPSS